MKTLTVFTPTYNRKHTLPRTYESLCRQTSDDFEWLIIDDGSTDGTREWVEGLGQRIVGTGQQFELRRVDCPLQETGTLGIGTAEIER